MKKKRQNARLLLGALLLLICAVLWTLWNSREARERREVTLAGVPAFPQPRQEPAQRKPLVSSAKLPAVKPPPQRPRQRQDGVLSFVQGSKGTVALVNVNALFNTPLAERLRRCLPKEFHDLESGVEGLDFTRDLDRVAFTPGGGMVVSGFFEGKPAVQKFLQAGATGGSDEYRGATIVNSDGNCRAQMGNLVVFGPSGSCRDSVDRALEPTSEAAPDEIYGDLYLRSDLEAMRGSGTPPELKPLVDALSGLTLRANVWDSVALSVEGNPTSGKDARELEQMARGAMQLFKGQLGDDQVELQALAELTKVTSQDGKLSMDLALPVADLFEKLHLPCPGLEDAGVP
jgi:hypothetical protein